MYLERADDILEVGTCSPDAPDCLSRAMSACASVWFAPSSSSCALLRSVASTAAQSAASDLRRDGA